VVRRTEQAATEDYLKTIWGLTEWGGEGPVSNAAVAERLGVATSSVSEMVRRLSEKGLVRHEPWRGFELTVTGQELAKSVVRRHRLCETFLLQTLGYSWDEVHAEADVLEHAMSDLMVERVDRLIGFPFRDPHGDPIPTSNGEVHRPRTRPMGSLGVGERGFVARIIDDSSELLRWLADRQIGLDVAIEVVEQLPFGGPLVVAIRPEADRRTDSAGDGWPRVQLGPQAVAALWVAHVRPNAPNPHRPSTSAPRPGCPYPDCDHSTNRS